MSRPQSTSRSPPTARGLGLLMGAPQILCMEGRDSFAYHFAFSKDGFHAENSIKTEFHCNSLSKSTNKPEMRRDWGTHGRGQGIYGDRKEQTVPQGERVLFMPHFWICSSSLLIYFLGCFFPQLPPTGSRLLGKEESQAQGSCPLLHGMNPEGVCEHPQENLLLL